MKCNFTSSLLFKIFVILLLLEKIDGTTSDCEQKIYKGTDMTQNLLLLGNGMVQAGIGYADPTGGARKNLYCFFIFRILQKI
jgi:hypothetical protein